MIELAELVWNFVVERLSTIDPSRSLVAGLAWVGLTLFAAVVAWMLVRLRGVSPWPRALVAVAQTFVAVAIPLVVVAGTLVEAVATRYEQRLDELRSFSAIRPQIRNRPVPDAAGEYWFYSFYRRNSDAPGLVLCKERVIIEPSNDPSFDFRYHTLPAQSTCDSPYNRWRGALVWISEHSAFLDYGEEPGTDSFLIAYLVLPVVPERLADIDAIGFQLGPGDFSTLPISNMYILSRRNLSSGDVLNLMTSHHRPRVAVEWDGARTSLPTCIVQPSVYGDAPVAELIDCGGREVVVPYIELSGPPSH